MIGVRPFQRRFDGNAVLFPGDENCLGNKCVFGRVQVLHEGGYTACIFQNHFIRFSFPQVLEDNPDA